MRPLDRIRSALNSRQELAELRGLHHRLTRYSGIAEETWRNLCQRAAEGVLSREEDGLKRFLAEPAWQLCAELLLSEGHFVFPKIDLNPRLSQGEAWQYTEAVKRQLRLFEHTQTAQHLEETLKLFLYNLIHERLESLPTGGEGDGALLFVPLFAMLANPAEVIESIYSITFRTPDKDGTFDRLGERLEYNLAVASGIDPARTEDSRKQPVLPTQATDKSPSELIETYLAGTPFVKFFNTPMPFSIPLPRRFEHMHVVGGSGHGKTQLLQSFILRDVEKVAAGERSIIIIDSQGDMLSNILTLSVLGQMPERTVVIWPKDIDHPPALNLFDFGLDRANRYAPVQREMLINGAIALYEYVFGALLGAELTQRQGVIFRYLARLMMKVPGATIHTLMDFMQEPESTRPYLPRLDPVARRFFDTQFYSKAFDDTRQQILTRLWGVLSNSVLERMFANKRNKLNLFEAMNTGSLILINTAKDLLKQEGCEILGRFFIALICQAAQERASIPEDQRTPTFVYIDEAHDYFDESMENLLNQARKYKVGLVLAHQNLGQFDSRLRQTVMSSSAIKMVGGLSAADASAFAKEMWCKPEFLQGVRKHRDFTEFACTVRNYTARPVRLSIPFGQMEAQPKIHPAQLQALLQANRDRYCADDRDDPPGQPPLGDNTPPEPESPLGDPELL